jgi:hypothetical protein
MVINVIPNYSACSYIWPSTSDSTADMHSATFESRSNTRDGWMEASKQETHSLELRVWEKASHHELLTRMSVSKLTLCFPPNQHIPPLLNRMPPTHPIHQILKGFLRVRSDDWGGIGVRSVRLEFRVGSGG